MTEPKEVSSRLVPRPPSILFAPLAWLKLQYFCHAGDTEISGFAITAQDDPLYVEDFVTVRQHTSSMTVAMDDQAVTDFMDRCVDQGLRLQNVLRVWMHTHPGSSAQPSSTDEATFARVFGLCDWAVMFILSRAGNTFARMSLNVGPGAAVQLPVAVDWSAWPRLLTDPVLSLANCVDQWREEFATNILPIRETAPLLPLLASDLPNHDGRPWEPLADAWNWTDLDQELLEDFERHERTLNDDLRP